MEPILSKLQEGVKYPRFERDATKTINDLVDHITKERGVYSSSIEPNPNEHSIWFNTNDNTLYIYDGSVWETVSHNNISIAKNGEFYPYPVINVYDENIDMYDWAIEENKHYVIIINTNNIREYLNKIVKDIYSMDCVIIGDDTNISGTFLVNIYNNYIYYIKLSSSYIKEDNVFYCTEGMIYYDADNTNYYGDGLVIRGFYTKERVRDRIEDFEGIPIESLMLKNIFIEPEDDANIIIGKQVFNCDVSILGEHLNNANIYMYNNTLHIGNNNDNYFDINYIGWYDATVYCNCKEIGDITITHENSLLNMVLYSINFVVGNNNKLIINRTIIKNIDNAYIYVIKESDNDKSSVYLETEEMIGGIEEYVNLCGTKLTGSGTNLLYCNTFITTTIDDIDRTDSGIIDLNSCNIFIIDAHYRALIHTEYIELLKNNRNLNLYVTDTTLYNFLKGRGLPCEIVTQHNIYYDNSVVVNYKDKRGTNIYNNIIYKQ